MISRSANSEDQSSIIDLLTQLRSDYPPDEAQISADLQQIIDDPLRNILLVLDDDKIVGMGVINIVIKLEKREARVDEVVVEGSMRGKGTGTFLMQEIEQWCWGQGCTAIEFTSRPERGAANALYQKLGYQIRQTNVYNKAVTNNK